MDFLVLYRNIEKTSWNTSFELASNLSLFGKKLEFNLFLFPYLFFFLNQQINVKGENKIAANVLDN